MLITFALRLCLRGTFMLACSALLLSVPSLWAQSTPSDTSNPVKTSNDKASTAKASSDKGGNDKTGNDKSTDTPKPAVKRTSTEKSVGKPMTVNPINKSDLAKGCGCGFYSPTSAREEGPLLLWLDNKGNATITIDGKREQLNLSSERMIRRGKDNGKLSAGDRVLVTLRGVTSTSATVPSLQASISSSAERNCTISSSQCSAPTFKSLISLSRGDSRKSLAAWSVCSCPGSSKPYSPSVTAGSNPPQTAKQSETRPAQP
jgi:hypothetical protein